jgi:tritrans,polycis-undecaprenyl-diphosphate synthase [geranylgeranyl-diphosphate specific]
VSIRSIVENVYAKRLRRRLTRIPVHVAIIQDSNRRYAKAHGMNVGCGHRLGVGTTERVLDWMKELDIRHVTFFAFFTENFHRSETEKEELR